MKRNCGTCSRANWQRGKDGRRMGGPDAMARCSATIPGEIWPEGWKYQTFRGRIVGVLDHENCPAWTERKVLNVPL